MEPMEEEPVVTLDVLPYECLVECLTHLSSAVELCGAAQVSQTLREAAEAERRYAQVINW